MQQKCFCPEGKLKQCRQKGFTAVKYIQNTLLAVTHSVVVLKGLSVNLTVKNAFAPIICMTVVSGLDGSLKDLPLGF